MPDRRALLERAARRAHLENAAWSGWGVCDECNQARFVVRKRRARKRLCLECFDQGFR